MDNLSNFLNEHKKPCIIACVVLLVFISLSFARCSQVQTEHAAAEQQAQAGQDDQKNEALAQLSSEQRNKQQGYTSDIQQAIDVLSANLWCTEDKQKLVTFDQTTFTQRTDSGDSDTVAYVVDAIDISKEQTTPDYSSEIYTLAIETPEDSFILTLTREDGEGDSFQYFLKSSGLAGGAQVYSTISSNANLAISSLNQDALQLVGNDEEGLKKALQDYAAQYLPATTSVTWEKNVTIDWENGTVVIPFDFDSTSAPVQVVYNRSEKTFSVESIR